MSKKIEVDGRVYPSIQAFVDAYGYSRYMVESRRKRGWSWDKIAHTPVRSRASITCNGKVYENIDVFSAEYNLSVATVCSRRNRGWTWEEIALTPVNDKCRSSQKFGVDYNGETYSSLRAFASAYNISYDWVCDKYHLGWSLDEIVERGLNRQTRTKQTYTYKGVDYRSVTDLARAVNMSFSSLQARLKSGKSVEEAVRLPVRNEIYWSVTHRDDVLEVKSECGGRYALITCKVCNRKVMLPIEDARVFTHSDVCERYEWL